MISLKPSEKMLNKLNILYDDLKLEYKDNCLLLIANLLFIIATDIRALRDRRIR